MTKFSWNYVKIPSQRVDSCLQPLGIIPGKAQFYHKILLLHPSLPQPELETGCILYLFLNVGQTGQLLVSVAWERLQCCAEHPDSPKTTSAPSLRESAVPCWHTALPDGRQRPRQPEVLHMAPGQQAMSAQVSARLKRIWNALLNLKCFW